MTPVDVFHGGSPLVLAFPHSGTFVPEDLADRFNAAGHALADTDWYVDRLYDGLAGDATKVRANFHRYVIDANRDPSGVSLYPGQNTTGLCPLTDFHGNDIYEQGYAPDAAEIERRRVAFHAPYHDALNTEINRVCSIHGFAVLYDCHSIKSEISYLFDGTLPDFNIGTFDGNSCDKRIEDTVAEICARQKNYSSVVNGRFKGGWTTRHYGKPNENIHAIQMELAQSTYMSEGASPDWIDEKAAAVRIVLKDILDQIIRLAPETGS